ncbi:MAG: winged helix-turn-helix domain-containing protein [Bacteroidota bacterium]
MKKSVLFIGLILAFLGLQGTSAVEGSSFEEAKEEVIMRQIGHQILLHSGDSLSRVLPIKKLAQRKYQVHFESPFSFAPDSLVATIDRIIKNHELSDDYVVQVLNCGEQSVIYGYAIMNSTQDDIIPCSSRPQPKSCYYLNIQFSDTMPLPQKQSYFPWTLSFLGISLAGSAIWFYLKNQKQEKNTPSSPTHQYAIGKAIFNFEEQHLLIENEQIALTPTEAKLLQLFAIAPNQVIEKSVIQKEIWQHDGEIISRSLDVFISKLRKKLKGLENVQLVNVHGKGYRLEVV